MKKNYVLIYVRIFIRKSCHRWSKPVLVPIPVSVPAIVLYGTGPDKSLCAHICISQIPFFEKMYMIYVIVVYRPLCRNFRKFL